MTFVDDEQSGHFYLHSTLVPLFCMMYDYMFFQVAWIEVDFYQLLCIFSLARPRLARRNFIYQAKRQ